MFRCNKCDQKVSKNYEIKLANGLSVCEECAPKCHFCKKICESVDEIEIRIDGFSIRKNTEEINCCADCAKKKNVKLFFLRGGVS